MTDYFGTFLETVEREKVLRAVYDLKEIALRTRMRHTTASMAAYDFRCACEACEAFGEFLEALREINTAPTRAEQGEQ